MNRRKALAALGAFAASPALSAEPQRYWVVPKEAIARLKLTPLASMKISGHVLAFPGEDGQEYSQDDVLRGVLTYMFSR